MRVDLENFDLEINFVCFHSIKIVAKSNYLQELKRLKECDRAEASTLIDNLNLLNFL